MADQQLRSGAFAAKLREQRRGMRDLMAELVYREWGGDPSHERVLAALHRASRHLEVSARRLAGGEPPTLRAPLAGLLMFAVIVTVALMVTSVPARPAAVTALVMGSTLASWVLSDATVAIRHRTSSAQPPPPFTACGTIDEAVTEALRVILAGLDGLLSDGDPLSGDDWRYALEQTRVARAWVALAMDSCAPAT